MKKLLNPFLLLLLLISCNDSTDDINLISNQNFQSLSDDELFFEFLHENKIHYEKITNFELIEILTSKTEPLTAMELADLSNALGYENYSELHFFYTKQLRRIEYLRSKYDFSDLTYQELELAVIEGFKKIKNGESASQKIELYCEEKRDNCYLSVLANGTLAHFACATLDLTVIAGIICHSAVLVYQAAESKKCDFEYLECLANQENQ